MDIKGEINSNKVIVRAFNTSLTSMDKSSKEKINKVTVALNGTFDYMDLIEIFRVFYRKAAKYKFFSSAHETFSG